MPLSVGDRLGPPDGKRFAVFEPEGEQKPETHVNVLLNFFDEVRRRAPAGK
jgi:hypothetical protein